MYIDFIRLFGKCRSGHHRFSRNFNSKIADLGNNAYKNFTIEYRIIQYILEIKDFSPLGTRYKYNNRKLIETI